MHFCISETLDRATVYNSLPHYLQSVTKLLAVVYSHTHTPTAHV